MCKNCCFEDLVSCGVDGVTINSKFDASIIVIVVLKDKRGNRYELEKVTDDDGKIVIEHDDEGLPEGLFVQNSRLEIEILDKDRVPINIPIVSAVECIKVHFEDIPNKPFIGLDL